MTITTPFQAQSGGSLDELLGAGLRALDISAAERRRAEAYYQGFGKVVDERWAGTTAKNEVFAQGSFALGTVTRPFGRDDELDLDAVAKKGVAKDSITRQDLKQDVGGAAGEFARLSAARDIEETDRCWTLQWQQMHMDILPAIPDAEARTSTALLIPDRSVSWWEFSDPQAYAGWFRGVSIREFVERQIQLSKGADVADIPAWTVKTTLQQAVQALKRHRNLFFTDNYDGRPSSIVITTLAALAYQGDGNLYDVLRVITSTMSEYLRFENGVWWLPNPVNDKENFVDSWEEHPETVRNFFSWAERAAADFENLDSGPGLNTVLDRFTKALGSKASEAAARALSGELTTAADRSSLAVKPGVGELLIMPAQAPERRPQADVVRRNTFAGGVRD